MGRRGNRSLTLYRKTGRRVFFVSGWDPESRRVRHMSTGESVPALARVRWEQLQRAWREGERIWPEAAAGQPAPGIGLAGELEAFRAWRAPQVASHTLANDMSRLRAFAAACGAAGARTVTRRQVVDYTDRMARTHSRRTHNQVVLAMRVFFRWAAARRLRPDNPAEAVKLLRTTRSAVEHLTLAERDRLLEASRGSPLEPAILLAVGSGLRLGEVERLGWRDVDLRRGQLLVREAKGGRPRSVPVPKPIAARLGELAPPGRKPGDQVAPPLRWKSARADLVALGRKARCRTGWNLFRHTFGSLLAQKGVSLYKIGTWLGHRDPRTTMMHYAELVPGYDADVEL